MGKIEELSKLVSYNPDTGVFIWIDRNKGRFAGSLNAEGYVKIRFRYNGKRTEILAHRLAWYISNGEVANCIDHINHNRSDNRLINLRNVSNTENQRNRTLNKNNKSGVSGVRFRGSRWVAEIKIDGIKKNLGSFSSFSDAVNARKDAEVLYNFHVNHGKEA